MKKYLFILIFAAIFTTCTKNLNDNKLIDNSYLNSTASTKVSNDKIDNKQTYEINFNIENSVDCINIEMEGIHLSRTFPNENIPKRIYFIIEKKLQLPQFKNSDNKKYMPIGRNFNNDWETSSPVKICADKNDSLSSIEATEYRIRFTIFDNIPFYYTLKIRCASTIIFN